MSIELLRRLGRWLALLASLVVIGSVLIGDLTSLIVRPAVKMPGGDVTATGVSSALESEFLGITGEERLHFIVQFRRELSRQEAEEIRRGLSIELDGPVPENAYITSVRVDLWPSVRDALVTGSPKAIRIFGFRPQDKLSPELGDPASPIVPFYAERPVGRAAVFIRFFDDVPIGDQRQILRDFDARQAGRRIVRRGPTGIWAVTVPDSSLTDLADVDGVRFIEPMTPPVEEDMDQARDEVGAPALGFDGTGSVIAQWEACQSAIPLDMQGRVTQVGAISPFCTAARHPTLVAGILISNSASMTNPSSQPIYPGIAPAASVRSHAWNHSSMTDEYPDAIAAGARISSNSFGWQSDYHFVLDAKPYNGTSQFYDEVSSGRRQTGASSGLSARMLVVASSGNKGDQPAFWRTGRIVNSAKNVIAVGNVSSAEAADPDAGLGIPAHDSGRGPTMDDRLTPILSAPGDQLQCISSGGTVACGPDGDGGITSTMPDGTYQATRGTSLSTPIVSGAAALLSHVYEDACGSAPVPQDLRALLVHSAKDLTRASNLSADPPLDKELIGPDYVFGYGLIQADQAYELLHHTVTDQIESGWVEHRVLLDSFDQLVENEGVHQMRVTLVWDDPPYYEEYPPRAVTGILQNDLDLEVIDPSGNRYLPWVLDPTPGKEATPATKQVRGPLLYVLQEYRDHKNTIEQVVLDVPAGMMNQTWKIRVRDFRIRRGPQAYTLVSEVFVQDAGTDCGDFSNGDTIRLANPYDLPDTRWAWVLFWVAVIILVWLTFETILWLYESNWNVYGVFVALLMVLFVLLLLYGIFRLLYTGDYLLLSILVLLLMAYVLWRATR